MQRQRDLGFAAQGFGGGGFGGGNAGAGFGGGRVNGGGFGGGGNGGGFGGGNGGGFGGGNGGGFGGGAVDIGGADRNAEREYRRRETDQRSVSSIGDYEIFWSKINIFF